MKRIGIAAVLCMALATGAVTGCAGTSGSSASGAATASSSAASETSSSASGASGSTGSAASSSTSTTTSTASLDSSELFTNRDLEQSADLTDAEEIELASGEDVTITEEGVYVVSGTATDATITVEADENAKVQIVLDGATITNSSAPAIYVVSADKVFVTTADGTTNTLSTTNSFASTGDGNVDGVIFAKDDLVLNGMGTLVIESSDNGIVGKDDVKVTGGSYEITASGKGIEANDRVLVGGGTLDIDAAEGIEATLVQIEDGTLNITASDDGINATANSTDYDVAIVIDGGSLTIDMGSGDTDALDSNGDLTVNGGTVDITAQFAFDFDGTGSLNGGTVTVNGEQVTEIENSMMEGGAGGMGGPGQGQGGRGMDGQGQGGMR